MKRLYAVPFLLLLLVIIGLPLWAVLMGSFPAGEPLKHYTRILTSKFYLTAFRTTLWISLLTTAIGMSLALVISIVLRYRSEFARQWALVFGNIGSNFAGVPAVLSFIILLGSNGVLTLLLIKLGIIDELNFYSFTGLVITYSFFQIALGVVLILPVIVAIPAEMGEASRLMGVPFWRFWAFVGIPVVGRQLIAVAILLFANAMGTYATAYALMGTNARILTVRIGELVAGDVFSDPGLANALSILLLLTLIVPIALTQYIQQRGRT